MMIRRSISIALVSVIAGALGMFTFAAPISQTTGTWHSLGSLVDVRQGASATMLDDGRVLVAGGSNVTDLLASAEVVSADGSTVPVAAMNLARTGHTATKLRDGRVLVTGGADAGGVAMASAEIFTPWSGTWTPASMSVARRHHTATLIRDDSGLVVIAGGENAGGVLSSVEVFDPASGAFAPLAAAMSSARTRHAAAPLPDGQVIVIGGSTGASVAGTTDIVNALTGAAFAGPSMTDARKDFTATELLNGDVLVVGGVGGANGTTELAAAEKLVVATGVFISANGLPGPRHGHQAVRLPRNAGVLVVGGTAFGQPLRSVDLFLPESQVFRMTSPTDMEHTAGALAPVGTGLAASAGGTGTAAVETYAFATVTTDYEDYAPGTTVTMTGSGWTPNEPVTLVLREEFGAHPPRTFTALANALGNFTNSEFVPEEHHIGVRFFLTATQGSSEAQHTFLDGVTNLAITLPTTVSPVSITSVALPSPVTVAFNYTTNGSGGTIAATASVKNGATVIASNSKAIARANGGGGASESVVVTVPAGTAAGSYTVEVTVAQTGGSGNPASMTATQSAAVVITSAATTTSIDAPSIVYDANGMVTVTVTGSGTPTGTVTLAVDGGSAVGKPLASGSAMFTSADIPALSSPTAGNHALSASFAAQNGFQASSATGTLVVGQATSTTTVTCPANVTYTALAQTPCTVTVTGAGGLSLTPTATYSNNTNAGTATASYTFAGDTNHEGSDDSENFTIDKAQPVCTIAGYNVTYDGNSHTAIGSCLGVLAETLTGLSLTGTTHTNAGNYPNDPWSFVDDTGNYYDKNGTVADAIAKANASFTVTPYNVTYDGQPHTATVGTISGVNGETGAAVGTIDLSGTTHTNAGTYAGDAWTFTGTANYNDANGTVDDAISKANASFTVTPYSVTYDGLPHTATVGTISGVNGETGAVVGTINLSGTTHTNAGTYTGDAWTFTGGSNYNDANGTVDDAIGKAIASFTVTPYNVTYDGLPHTATVGTISGVNGETGATVGTINLGATTHTNAGTYAGDAWTFTGGTNYNDANGTVDDAIGKANASFTVTPYNVTYDGLPHTATVGTISGVNGETGATVGTINLGATTHTNAGTYAGDAWTFTGGTNYNDANGTVDDAIGKANASFTVTPYNVTYDGLPHTATVGTISGVNGETGTTVGTINLSGTTHTNAGTYAGDAWTFTGGTNYNDADGTVDDAIDEAPSTTVVTCPANVTYTGFALTPCTVSVTGVGGLNLTPTPAYLNNTSAGIATASYTFTGDVNHDGSNDSKFFTIDQAASTTTVTCGAGPFIYNGDAHTPCLVTVTGASLSLTPPPTYVNNTNAGTATASYTYGGDLNHTSSSDSENFTIGTRNATVAAQNKSKIFGAAMTPDQSAPGDFTVTGLVGADAVASVTLASPGYPAPAAPGSHPITPSNATGTGLANYNISYTPATLSVTFASGACMGSPGRTILQPINPDGSSVFKQKSTAPAKFRVCDANGNSVGLPGTVTGFAMIMSSSGTYSEASEAPDSTTPDTAFRWSATDQQWIFNISTKSLAANKTYLFRISLADGTFIDFAFGLK